MISEEWGPWIEHDRSPNPCRGAWIEVIDSGGHGVEGVSGVVFPDQHWIAGDMSRYTHILRYRIRKPKGLTILHDILREVEREPEMV